MIMYVWNGNSNSLKPRRASLEVDYPVKVSLPSGRTGEDLRTLGRPVLAVATPFLPPGGTSARSGVEGVEVQPKNLRNE